ncbi:MAG: S1 family peptidase, partial [Pyrinomonadaceae bacterium]
MDSRIRIGTGEDCELRLSPEDLTLEGSFDTSLLLQVQQSNGQYRVDDFDHSLVITHNASTLLKNSQINDGDEIRFVQLNLALRFFYLSTTPSLLPFPTRRKSRSIESSESADLSTEHQTSRDEAKTFLREFTRELVREISISTRIILLLIMVSLAAGVLYLGFAVFRELRASHRSIDQQSGQLGKLQNDVGETSQEVKKVQQSNLEIQRQLSLPFQLQADYGSGVCLILTSYVRVEQTSGRILRYPETNRSESARASQPTEHQLTPEGNGSFAIWASTGTGFHIGDGYVLTNRHVVEPWTADDNNSRAYFPGLSQPKIYSLLAFFPKLKRAIPLKIKRLSRRNDIDVAVCQFELEGIQNTPPALPLDREPDENQIGKKAVMIAYTSGTDRLTAQLGDQELQIAQRFSQSPEQLLGYLAEKNYISPLV